MYAYRVTWIIKQGCMRKAVDLLKEETARAKSPKGKARIYTPDISPNALVWEDAWESLEDHQKAWDDYNASPEGAAFYDKFNKLVERRVATERWILTEL